MRTGVYRCASTEAQFGLVNVNLWNFHSIDVWSLKSTNVSAQDRMRIWHIIVGRWFESRSPPARDAFSFTLTQTNFQDKARVTWLQVENCQKQLWCITNVFPSMFYERVRAGLTKWLLAIYILVVCQAQVALFSTYWLLINPNTRQPLEVLPLNAARYPK